MDEALTPESGLTETESAPAPAPSEGGLKLDRAGGDASEEGGPAGWLIAAALAATALGLFLVRRRLPRRRSA